MVNFQFKSLCHDIYLLCIEIQSNIVNKLPYSEYSPPTVFHYIPVPRWT